MDPRSRQFLAGTTFTDQKDRPVDLGRARQLLLEVEVNVGFSERFHGLRLGGWRPPNGPLIIGGNFHLPMVLTTKSLVGKTKHLPNYKFVLCSFTASYKLIFRGGIAIAKEIPVQIEAKTKTRLDNKHIAEVRIQMNTIASHQSSLFLNAASAGPMTSAWGASFPVTARCNEAAVTRLARRQLRRSEPEAGEWQEVTARAVLVASMLGAYVAAFWQITF